MRLEVTLIESDPDIGIRVLGRTTDETLVALVRDHLINRLNQPGGEPGAPKLTVVPRSTQPVLEEDDSFDR